MNHTRLALSLVAALGVAAPLTVARADIDREPRSFEWLRFHAGLGYQHVWLRTLMVDEDRLGARVVPEALSGPAPAIGLSCKLWLVSLGVTGRVAQLSGAEERPTDDVKLWSVDGEMTLRAPSGQLQPFVLLGGGYAALDDVDGLDLRGGLGVDYYITSDLSLRLDGTGDFMMLGQSGIPSQDDFARDRDVNTVAEAQARADEMDGSTAGAALALNAGVGVHF
jgi:hypothetical protein